jgi:hypothetical protein
MKYDKRCGDAGMRPENLMQLLVVGVQRSGTHYTWEMLNRLGVHVHHEGVGPDGAVAWPYAVKYVHILARSNLCINNLWVLMQLVFLSTCGESWRVYAQRIRNQ